MSTNISPKVSKSQEFKKLYDEFLVSTSLDEEFEIRFGTKGKKKITKIDFDNVISYLKSKGFIPQEKNTTLKIQVEYTNPRTGKTEFSSIRTEIENANSISNYCKTNQVFDGTNFMKDVLFRQKRRKRRTDGTFVKFLDYNEFNFRISYQEEKEINKTSNIINQIVSKWSDRKKLFRLIDRYRFKHNDFPNVFVDMSVVKTSKKNIRNNMIPAYNVIESDVFNSPETYEIEIEVNKRMLPVYMRDDYFQFLQKSIKYILSGLQQTNYPITYDEMKIVLQEYMNIVYEKTDDEERRIKTRNFIGPSSITLEMKNIQPLEEDNKIPNIRMPYSVTDKADGLRKLLFINNSGRIYFIDTNMNIQFTGAVTKSKDHFNSILDGEHVTHNKTGDFINLYASFDVYFIHNNDKRKMNFIQTNNDDEPTNYRLNLLNKFIQTLKPEMVAKGGTSLRVEMKTFYASTGETGKHTIFDSCRKVMQKIDNGLLEYETDGLIFTPIDYGVGLENKNDDIFNYKKTWMRSFKWKPAEQNTVDFLVTTKKDQNGRDLISNIFEEGQNNLSGEQITQYKTLILRVGFNEKIHGYINPCKDIIEDKIPNVKDKDNNENYKPMPFYPMNPSDNRASICNILLKKINDNEYMTTEDGDEVFEDNMIVEFKYHMNANEGWKWKPIRVRYDKTAEYRAGLKNYGNAFHVAQSVWTSLHNPITKEMITTGINIPLIEENDDVYYNRTGKSYTKELRDFHNLYVKKKLITGVSKRGDTLYDLAVGKGGDFTKWIASNLKFVFGVDVSKDNIENRKDGACARYLNYKKEYDNMLGALFVAGNSSLNIKDGTGVFSEKGKQIVKAVFGEGSKDKNELGEGVYKYYGIGKEGFNVVSTQFALHYFFKNQETLHNFVRNVAEGCSVGGYFIGTSYDGKSVFNRLRTKKIGESIVSMDGNYKLWEITKMYEAEEFPNDETSLGYRIDVYQETINKVFSEYLVNYDYFHRVMMNYGFELINRNEAKKMRLPNGSGMFEELYIQMKNDIRSEKRGKRKGNTELEVGKAVDLDKYANQKQISFLNRYFVYKKVRDANPTKVQSNMSGELVGEEKLEKELTRKLQDVSKETIHDEKDVIISRQEEHKKQEDEKTKSKTKKKTKKKTLKKGKMKLQIIE